MNLLPSLAEVEAVSSIDEALAIQANIGALVRIPDDEGEEASKTAKKDAQQDFDRRVCKRILALDVAYSTSSDLIVASGVLYRYNPSPSGKKSQNKNTIKSKLKDENILAEKVSSGRVKFPYHAGLLAFREIPLLTNILDELLPSSRFSSDKSRVNEENYDDDGEDDVVLLCDGAGIAHPRFCGLACHLGVLYQVPSLGVAKNHLIGDYDESSLGSIRGSNSILRIQSRPVGTVLRSQTGIRPIFVSPGHQLSISQSNQIALDLCHQFRIPEPLRRADHIGRMELKRIEEHQRN